MAREIQKFMVGIKAFITRGDEVLLVKSGANREPLWEVPGGRYDVGEEGLAPEDIVAREIREELGSAFRCRIEQPVTAWVRPLRENYVFLLAYNCPFEGGEIHLSDEHVEFRWVSPTDVQDLPLAPGYRQALDHFWKNR